MRYLPMLFMAFVLVGCERGCAALGQHAMGTASSSATGALPRPAIDCPDGLARCEEGTVSVSRLATVPMPCSGPSTACTCPWEALEACPGRCAADSVEIVVDRALARSQLCAPGQDAHAFVAPLGSPGAATDAGDGPCDEGDRYRCAGGLVVECGSGATIGRCLRGCFSDGTSIGDDGVSREAAFAILCSR